MEDETLPFEPDATRAGAGRRPRVEVRRSARRRRTVSARMEGEVMVLMIPAGASLAQEQRWTEEMLAKLQRRSSRSGRSDAELAERAERLARRFDLPVPASVRWVTNQGSRWGSCTPARGSIRLSHRLQQMPDYVVDSVLVHELAHLLESGHGPRFRALVARYPQRERADGYLEGASAASGWDPQDW